MGKRRGPRVVQFHYGFLRTLLKLRVKEIKPGARRADQGNYGRSFEKNVRNKVKERGKNIERKRAVYSINIIGKDCFVSKIPCGNSPAGGLCVSSFDSSRYAPNRYSEKLSQVRSQPAAGTNSA